MFGRKKAAGPLSQRDGRFALITSVPVGINAKVVALPPPVSLAIVPHHGRRIMGRRGDASGAAI